MSQLNLPPPRVPITDPKTGIITREWDRYFRDLFNRTGGSVSVDLTAVVALIAGLTIQADGNEQGPAQIQLIAADDFALIREPFDAGALDEFRQAPIVALTDVVEHLQTEVRSLSEQLADAINQINELKQGTML
jgi:hypothetical protein